MAKRRAFPDRDICVACGVCVLQCPREAIRIHKGCYAVVDEDACVGCGICSRACPGEAIMIEEASEVMENAK